MLIIATEQSKSYNIFNYINNFIQEAMAMIKQLTGLKFGRLTAMAMLKEKGKRIMWVCHCDCGMESIMVRSDYLNNGTTKSCGCIVQTNDGLTSDRKTYSAWKNMIRRCYDPRTDSYNAYGLLGTKVCEEWRSSFIKFYDDMGKAPNGKQLDRKNNLGDYEPSNCRWVTPLENCNNKKNNRRITFNRKIKTIAQWAREYNISNKTLRQRIDRDGYSFKEAISIPVVPGGFKYKTDRRLTRRRKDKVNDEII